jgi:ABC-type nitrate/sulfonate/bicarbonate transport system ATPase subunit
MARRCSLASSWSWQPAGWTCLLGPSGVGKTTLLRLLAGLETHGTFDGRIQRRAMPAAYMAQQDLLMPWLDVTGNVTLGARLRGETPELERARMLIAKVGLGSHATQVSARAVRRDAPARGTGADLDGRPAAGAAGRTVLGA